ncbi:MAG: hypothetical protein AB7D92_04490 [Sphaerochaeta sp.]
MKRSKLILVLLGLGLLIPSSLSAGTFLGVSQGLVATSLEIGILGRRAEQHIAFSLPLVRTEPENYFKAPSMSATISLRTLRFKPLVLSAGVKSQVSWEGSDGYIIGLGGTIALSYEFIKKGEVLFLEGSYLPLITTQGVLSTDLGEQQLKQWIRLGYRHAF